MDLQTRAQQVLADRVPPYTSRHSTCFRVCEVAERVPQPTYVQPTETVRDVRCR